RPSPPRSRLWRCRHSQTNRVRGFYSHELQSLARDRRHASSYRITKVERVVLNALAECVASRPDIAPTAIALGIGLSRTGIFGGSCSIHHARGTVRIDSRIRTNL